MNILPPSHSHGIPCLPTRLLPFFCLFLAVILSAQPDVEWSYGYGGTLNEIPHALQKTADGGFIIVGQSASSDIDVSGNLGGYDLWVTKINAGGELEWEKNYGGSNHDFARDIQLTEDGGYVLAGGSFSDDGDVGGNNGRGDLWVLKLNSSGNLQWSHHFGGSGTDVATAIQPTSDHGFIVAGSTGSSGEPGVAAGYGGNDFWVIKLNPSGELDWQKTYGGAHYDAVKALLVTTDGGFLIGGNTWSTNGDVVAHHGQSDAWVLKTDSLGNIQWSKTFGGITTDQLNDLVVAENGHFVMAGTYGEFRESGSGYGGRYDENFWLLQFDTAGTEIWSQTYGSTGYDEALCLSTTLDSGYIVGGSVTSGDEDATAHFGNKDFWILKTNAIGELIWSKTLGGLENETVHAVEETNDGGYLLAGFSNSVFVDTLLEGKGYEDWWILKTQSPFFSVDLGPDLILCENEAFSLNVEQLNCNCTYLWNDGSTDSIRNLSLENSTHFSVTITHPIGYTFSDEIDIVISTPSFDLNASDISCYGNSDGAITTSPNGTYDYVWSNDSTSQNLSNLAAGNYTVTATDTNQCSLVQQIIISEPAPITVAASIDTVICSGGNSGAIDLAVDGGVGNFSYLWSNGATTSNIDQLSADDYQVTITDSNNCEAIQNFTVSSFGPIDVTIILSHASCFGEDDAKIEVIASGGSGNYSYLWSTGDTTAIVQNLSPGTYTVTVSDDNGCTSVHQDITLTDPPEIDLVFQNIQPTSCFDSSDGSVEVLTTGGVGGYTIEWVGAINTELPPGLNFVMVTDSNGCQVIDSIKIPNPPPLDVLLQTQPPVNGNDGSITAIAMGGTPAYNYLWSDGQTTATAINLSTGSYSLTLTDFNGCQFDTLILLEPTAIESINQLELFEIYPNPNNGQFYLNLELAEREEIDIFIINELGQIIQKHKKEGTGIYETIHLSTASSGVYFVVVHTGHQVAIKKLMVLE